MACSSIISCNERVSFDTPSLNASLRRNNISSGNIELPSIVL